MKFLILGDLHFRVRSPINRKDNIEEVFRDKFKQIKKIIKKEKIDTVLCVGDILDKARVVNETLLLADELLSSLEIPIITCVGNHDLVSNTMNNYNISSINILERLCSNLKIEREKSFIEIDNIRIYINNWGNDNFIVEDIDNEYTNIMLTHSMIVEGEGMFESIGVDEVKTNVDLLITGHNHCKFKTDNIYNAGSLVRLTTGAGDFDRQVEVGVLDTNTMNIEQVLLDIGDYKEVFNLDNKIKKDEILNQSILKELNDIISNVSSTDEIIHKVVETLSLNDTEIEELNAYLKAGDDN